MANKNYSKNQFSSQLSTAGDFSAQLPKRHRIGRFWLYIFQFSTLVGIIALSVLILNVTNSSSGYVAFETTVDPNSITGGVPLESLSNPELAEILQEKLTAGRYRTINNEKLIEDRTESDLREIVITDVIKPKIVKTWNLWESLSNKPAIEQEVITDFPDAYLQFRVWLTGDYISSPQSSNPMITGIRTAILGSIWIIFITIIIALPIGVGAAIYLEEYARSDRWINRVFQTNINNLAAVPSIIYGILGLTVFVRVLEPITSGSLLGFTDQGTTNGRTILSGGLTLALLVLPLIIINAQEAIRSVPNSLRQASFGVGATKWQTIWAHVLPNAIPGILTGAILALSRAFGETAPLLVVGVSTYITQDPTSFFSKFTTLPAQIYQWTARPQSEWRNIAAAAIIVLLIMLLILNSIAILLRNKYSRKYV